jgi:DNA-binding LacI/PurR family transcriptional regulator
VSIQTVSNVVNGRPIVVESTRQRVLEAIEALGYQPNASARSLRTRRTNNIALVVIASERGYLVSAPYLDHALSGIIDGARDNDYHILLFSTLPGQSSRALEDLFGQQRIDGAIVAAAQLGEQFVDELSNSPVPFVLLERPVSGARAVSVRANSRLGGVQGVNYLVARGYRRIAFVGGLASWASALERLEGYRQGMSETGLQDQIRLVEGDWSLESGRRADLALLRDPDPPEAIFAANDVAAIGVLQAAREMGLSTPGDVAVMGYDDFNSAALVSPALTTIHMPAYELGLKAVELVMAYAHDGTFAQPDILIDTSLVIRASA